jgi:hypothetical protein
MAYVPQKTPKGASEPEPYRVMGLVHDTSMRLDLGSLELRRCVFRVKAAKDHSPAEDPPSGRPLMPTGDLAQYLWSKYSPSAQFKAPVVPDPPTGLRIAHLRDTSAVVQWTKPANAPLHRNLSYKVHLTQGHSDPFACVGHTGGRSFQLTNLEPNRHYRVAVAAESDMGVSTGNNALLFSTLPTPNPQGVDRPLKSLVPARAALKVPPAPEEPLAQWDALRRPLPDLTDAPNRRTAPMLLPPPTMTPVAAPSGSGRDRGYKPRTNHRPLNVEELGPSPFDDRSSVAAGGPSDPPMPFLPSLGPYGRAVSQPLTVAD